MKDSIHFVWNKQPFVGHKGCHILPTVGQNIPFSWKRASSSENYGFTMIELMVTVVVIAILATIATPAFNTLIRNSRISSQANEFLTDLAVARSEAIKRGQPVTLCKRPASGTVTCDTVATNPWTNGWILFLDLNNNGQVDAPPEEVLRVHAAVEGGNTIRVGLVPAAAIGTVAADGSTAIAPGARIVFKPSGITSINVSQSAEFRVCDARGTNDARAVALAAAGQARINKPPVNACP